MRADRLTDKSQEALQEALSVATRSGHPELLPEQFLVSVLTQTDAVEGLLIERASGSVEKLVQALSERIDKLPRVSGGAEPRMSQRMVAFMQGGEDEAKKLKDDFVSAEVFLLAAAHQDKDIKNALERQGITYEKLLQALADIRGSQRVTDAQPEGKFQALEKYTRDLTSLARKGAIDPVIGRDEEVRRVNKRPSHFRQAMIAWITHCDSLESRTWMDSASACFSG